MREAGRWRAQPASTRRTRRSVNSAKSGCWSQQQHAAPTVAGPPIAPEPALGMHLD